jgi:hypothetical protein
MLPGITPALFGGGASPGNDQFTVLLCHFDSQTDGSTIIVDSSPNRHGLATVGGTAHLQLGTGLLGSSSSYLNTGGYCTFPYSADWEFGAGDFTIDWWEYRTGAGCPLSRDLSTTYSPFLLEFTSAQGEIYMTSTGSSWDIANGAAGLPSPSFGPGVVSTWQHLAVCRKGSNFYAFRNGVLKSTWASALAIKSNANPLCIGAAQNGQNFNGYIEELRISKGIARWTANFTPPTKPYGPDPDLTARLLLHMDGPNGSKTFYDTSQWGKPNPTVGGNAKVSTAQSKFGGASAQFGATGDYLSYPTSAPDWDFGANDFTVEAWMFPTALPSDSTVIMHPSTATGFADAWKFVIRATDKIIRFVHSVSSSNIVQLQSVNPAVLNVWTHIAAVRSGNNLTLYVNGIAEATGTYSGALPAITGPLNIGTGDTTPGNAFFTGYIDEVRISNGLARWTANFTPPAAPYT